ncbi:hypothetical protein, partial [Sansalvadorimonas verongulae]|uniref:hypothetical protein n=1 Tax=Sansalvadorimonas verongulae TaxID=2172824 RepID=UPI001E4F8566
MIFRLNVVATSLCIVIGLSTAAIYAAEDKNRYHHLTPLWSVDVISTDSIAIHPADNTHIHPGETTSCTVNRPAENRLVHCHGEKQRTQVTLTESAAAQHLAVETDATTWIRNPSDICHISSNNEAPDIVCTPSSSTPFLDTLCRELSAFEHDVPIPSELSDLLQDDVLQSLLYACVGGGTLNTDDTLAEVRQSQSDSD